ncbi:MAG: MBOAT family protein [Lentisphaeria bacterium]|nr:MBOAT family protein [Lentisphaeria bacterium]
MLFSSMIFLWIFLPVVFIGYRLLGEKYRNLFLLLASIVFYGWGEPKNVIVMLVSILINYVCGIWIENFKDFRKKLFVTVCIVMNLGVLGYFKYMTPSYETLSQLLNLKYFYDGVALPIGISFYTFQAISYVVDVYRGTIKAQRNLIDMGLYITFFPQLIAGPIVKYHDIEPQLKTRELTLQDTAYGFRRFIYGLAKKVLIANNLAMISDDIFAIPGNALDTPAAWIGILAFNLQVYFDFSGYSDMAIGLGRMFGFRFMENFNYPYISTSIREFWQRWNISVFTWFREYLYFPLGGSKKGEFRTCLNIFIVFAATGIWHGAALNYMFWGIYFGIVQILERLWLKHVMERPAAGAFFSKPFWLVPSHLYFLLVVLISSIFFKTQDLTHFAEYFKITFFWHDNPSLAAGDLITGWGWGLCIIAALLCGPLQTMIPALRKALYREDKIYAVEVPFLLILLGVSIFCLSGSAYNPFIYFNF